MKVVYYLKSLPVGTGIKLVPDLGHTRPTLGVYGAYGKTLSDIST